MTTTLYAQPYDISASGFFFEDLDQYQTRLPTCQNYFGDPVEEFEIQLIDGEDIDIELGKAWDLSQANLGQFLEAVEFWDDDQKLRYIIAVGECGYSHAQVVDDPNSPDITLYQVSSFRELAEQFVDEGLFGEIPERLQFYIDYEAIARDLEIEYGMITIAGEGYIYDCR